MRAAIPPSAQPALVVTGGCGGSDAPKATRVVSAVDRSIESPTDFRISGVAG
jgi:hypothetical protein